jgi:hypothetical protein
MLEMFKVLQNKPTAQLRNGNYDLGSNQYMLFEAEPPAQLATKVMASACMCWPAIASDCLPHPSSGEEEEELIAYDCLCLPLIASGV